jgi:hypothetical protein
MHVDVHLGLEGSRNHISSGSKPYRTHNDALPKNILDLNSILHLPISQEAYLQLLQLAQMLENVAALNEPDIWTYVWGSPWFSASKAYTHLIGHRTVHPAFHWLWKSAVQNKHKVFF